MKLSKKILLFTILMIMISVLIHSMRITAVRCFSACYSINCVT